MIVLILTTLVENTTTSKSLIPKHGLCLHIKTKNHNILFDLGPDDTFIRNANKLNISIPDIDIVIISHGHKDHGGGLKAFLECNTKAKIYIHKAAFLPYYTSVFGFMKYYIGLDTSLYNNDRIVLTDDNFIIDGNISLFSSIISKHLLPSLNKTLLRKENNKYIKDEFDHEQNLILKEDNKDILIAGCAHNGITNIIEKAEKIIYKELDVVISGLHLFNPVSKKQADRDYIENLSLNLSLKKATFYTCHCTGLEPFNILHEELGNKVKYLSTGQIVMFHDRKSVL